MNKTTRNTKETSRVDVEALLKASENNKTTNKAILAAAATLKAEKDKEKEKELLEQLAEIQEETAKAVTNLRNARANEKRAKMRLEAVAQAEADFMKDADYNAYITKIRMAMVMLGGQPQSLMGRSSRSHNPF